MVQTIQFKGEWRHYQTRVLAKSEQHLKDGKIHIVAAPGSGKTTLGLELIGRLATPTLILVPTITIREQWVARLTSSFLDETIDARELVSQDLKQPKQITVVTYQALHSAISRFKGQMTEEIKETDDRISDVEEVVDFADFDLIKTMHSLQLGVICLDECHHLRNEWWKSLEIFKGEFQKAKIISLTATPPYDSTPSLWQRYINMCGEIDEEITTPELVKEGSLCPHQDFVYFSYPTREEKAQLDRFAESSQAFCHQLYENPEFEHAILTHQALVGEVSDDVLLECPAHLSSLLIFLQAKGLEFPNRLKELLATKRLPKLDTNWLNHLLQYFCYTEPELYQVDDSYRQELIRQMKAAGLIERNQVNLLRTQKLDSLLTQSAGKLKSIREIAVHEHQQLGSELRQLILTDYIRKEFEVHIGQEHADLNRVGVLPIFEALRQESLKQAQPMKLGILCGSLVVIPKTAEKKLVELLGTSQVTLAPFAEQEDYLKVTMLGSSHPLTSVVTELFMQGEIQILIGTKALLGEGWDAPCINSLILASFVGSFMLSNQMRGRAIRSWLGNPQKTANIWHLVCVNPRQMVLPDEQPNFEMELTKQVHSDREEGTMEESPDFLLLKRRTEHFLGLSYDGKTIESGAERLSLIKPPYTRKNVEKINRSMLALSMERQELRENWQTALDLSEQIHVSDMIEMPEQLVSPVLFFEAKRNAIRALLYGGIALFADLFVLMVRARWVGLGVAALILTYIGIQAFRFYKYRSPLTRLQIFGDALVQGLRKKGALSDLNSQARVEVHDHVVMEISLKGGTGRDKEIFSQAIKEFFAPIDNQRYLLYQKGRKAKREMSTYFAVPSIFSNQKEIQAFVKELKSYIGEYELIYTRTPAGRKTLLEARVLGLANQQNHLINKKKVQPSKLT